MLKSIKSPAGMSYSSSPSQMPCGYVGLFESLGHVGLFESLGHVVLFESLELKSPLP